MALSVRNLTLISALNQKSDKLIYGTNISVQSSSQSIDVPINHSVEKYVFISTRWNQERWNSC